MAEDIEAKGTENARTIFTEPSPFAPSRVQRLAEVDLGRGMVVDVSATAEEIAEVMKVNSTEVDVSKMQTPLDQLLEASRVLLATS